jgi:hypothetical protein
MMRIFGRALSSEILKLKRTLALKMIIVTPALAAVLSLFAQAAAVMSGRGDLARTLWQSHAQISLTIWAVFLLPLLIALQAALLASIEHGERQWKHLFASPVPRYAIYLAKLGIVQLLVLLSTLLLCAFIALSGGLLILWHPPLAAAGFPPLGSIVVCALQCWLAAGFILSINFWIALRWPSFTVPLASGIAGTFFAVFASSARVAKYYPWLLPSNVVSSTDRGATALAIGIGGGIIVAALGCADFCRREESESPNLGRTATVALCLIALVFTGFGALLDWGHLSGHTAPAVRFIDVGGNVRLEVLDWGGTGRPVLLLAGLGDTAHVFDAFASKLARSYHCVRHHSPRIWRIEPSTIRICGRPPRRRRSRCHRRVEAQTPCRGGPFDRRRGIELARLAVSAADCWSGLSRRRVFVFVLRPRTRRFQHRSLCHG